MKDVQHFAYYQLEIHEKIPEEQAKKLYTCFLEDTYSFELFEPSSGLETYKNEADGRFVLLETHEVFPCKLFQLASEVNALHLNEIQKSWYHAGTMSHCLKIFPQDSFVFLDEQKKSPSPTLAPAPSAASSSSSSSCKPEEKKTSTQPQPQPPPLNTDDSKTSRFRECKKKINYCELVNVESDETADDCEDSNKENVAPAFFKQRKRRISTKEETSLNHSKTFVQNHKDVDMLNSEDEQEPTGEKEEDEEREYNEEEDEEEEEEEEEEIDDSLFLCQPTMKEVMLMFLFRRDNARTLIRNIFKESSYLNHLNGSGVCILKEGKDIPDYRLMCSTEDLNIYYAMERGICTLEKLGISVVSDPAVLSPIVKEIKDPIFLPLSHFILKMAEITPWNLTESFLKCETGKAVMCVNGRGNPFPEKFGLSFLSTQHRLRDKHFLKQEREMYEKQQKNLSSFFLRTNKFEQLSSYELAQIRQDFFTPKCMKMAREVLLNFASKNNQSKLSFAWMTIQTENGRVPIPFDSSPSDFKLCTDVHSLKKKEKAIETITKHLNANTTTHKEKKKKAAVPLFDESLISPLSPHSILPGSQNQATTTSSSSSSQIPSLYSSTSSSSSLPFNLSKEISTVTMKQMEQEGRKLFDQDRGRFFHDPQKKKGNANADMRALTKNQLNATLSVLGKTEEARHMTRWEKVRLLAQTVSELFDEKGIEGVPAEFRTWIRTERMNRKEKDHQHYELLMLIGNNIYQFLRGQGHAFFLSPVHDNPLDELYLNSILKSSKRQNSEVLLQRYKEKLEYCDVQLTTVEHKEQRRIKECEQICYSSSDDEDVL